MRDLVNVRFDFIDGCNLSLGIRRCDYNHMLDNAEKTRYVFYDIAGKRDVVVNLNQVKLIIMSEIEEKKGWFSRWLG